MTAAQSTVAPNGTLTLSASGGVPPYQFAVVTGNPPVVVTGQGTIVASSSSTAIYTAPGYAIASVELAVTDSSGTNTSGTTTLAVSTSGQFQITPGVIATSPNQTATATLSGGSGSYTCAVVGGLPVGKASYGSCTVSSSTLTYTAASNTTVTEANVNIWDQTNGGSPVSLTVAIEPGGSLDSASMTFQAQQSAMIAIHPRECAVSGH